MKYDLRRGGGQVVWRSEFESHWSLQFFLQDLCLKRIKITKKEAGVGHFFKKNDSIRLVEFSETKLFAENENARSENSFKTRDVKISSFNAADLICSLTHLYLIHQI